MAVSQNEYNSLFKSVQLRNAGLESRLRVVETASNPTRYDFTLFTKYYVTSLPSLLFSLKLGNFFDGNIIVNGYHFWIQFYDTDGNILLNGDSSTFDPSDIQNLRIPSEDPIASGNDYEFVLNITDINAAKPDAATHFSLHFRITESEAGTVILNTPRAYIINQSITKFLVV